MLKRAKRDLDGALADYDKAIELKPDSATFYHNRGVAKRDKGRIGSAQIDFSKEIELRKSKVLKNS